MAVFRSFWHGPALSPYEYLCVKSFLDHGHEFILCSYRDIAVPAGVIVQDAELIVPEADIFFYQGDPFYGGGSIAGFSDVFRYTLLNRFGDWWTDLDVICLSPRVPPGDIVFGIQDEHFIATAVLKCDKDAPFINL